MDNIQENICSRGTSGLTVVNATHADLSAVFDRNTGKEKEFENKPKDQ